MYVLTYHNKTKTRQIKRNYIINQHINQVIFNQRIKRNYINQQIKSAYLTNNVSEQHIPLHIYQTWHNKNAIPPSVSECISNIITCNPLFTHHLCDATECREFIKTNFPSIVVDTYDVLIPHAFKADLWRYCMLYINGGIYLDVKYSCINNFNFITLTDKEYFCKDVDTSQGGVYNAIIICKPKNEILLKSIYKIVENVGKNYYGQHSLSPTGPLMMKQFFSTAEINNFELKLTVNPTCIVTLNDVRILLFNKNYRTDQKKYDKHWADYWLERNIYNTQLPQYMNVKLYKPPKSMETVCAPPADTV
jgi:mannosyltransferase OCH1-like enzyme